MECEEQKFQRVAFSNLTNLSECPVGGVRPRLCLAPNNLHYDGDTGGDTKGVKDFRLIRQHCPLGNRRFFLRRIRRRESEVT